MLSDANNFKARSLTDYSGLVSFKKTTSIHLDVYNSGDIENKLVSIPEKMSFSIFYAKEKDLIVAISTKPFRLPPQNATNTIAQESQTHAQAVVHF